MFPVLGCVVVGALLYIPWFKAHPWEIPLPFTIPLIHIHQIPIQPFGVLVAIGVLTGAYLAEWYAKRNGISPGAVADLVTHVVVTGFLLGYFLNAAFYHPETIVELFHYPKLLLTRWLGLSSFGGFLGAILGIFIWKWRRKVPVLPVADAIAFVFPFGWMFGRMGCSVVHDHPGKVTHFFLAVNNYHVGLPPYQPRHDLGLYEVFWSIGCIIVFLAILNRKRPRGLYVALLPLLYTPVRFFLDYLRAGPALGGDVRYYGYTPGQYASVVLLIVGLVILRYVLKHPDPELPEILVWPPPEEAGNEEPSKAAGTPAKPDKSKAATAEAHRPPWS